MAMDFTTAFNPLELFIGLIILFSGAAIAVKSLGLLFTFLFQAMYRRNIEKRWKEAQAEHISEGARAALRLELDNMLSKQTELEEQRATDQARLITFFAAIGGLVGLIYVFSHPAIIANFFKGFKLSEFVTAAFAEDRYRVTLAPIAPYIAAMLFSLMGLAFICSVFASLCLRNTKKNHARLKAADNIVKTFGGFFIGFMLALFK